jgi:RimJ/RimL family protein N-acetyltransferase
LLEQRSITHIIANTSDRALMLALYDHCVHITAPEVLFSDQSTSNATLSGPIFRKITDADFDALLPITYRPEWYPIEWDFASLLLNADLVEQHRSPVYPFEAPNAESVRGWIAGGYGWLLLEDQEIAGIGAIYEKNAPFVDLAMMVREPFRNRGYGTQIVQQLKARCYEAGLIPTAKCFAWNSASRRTLQRAGFLPCGRLLIGAVRGRDR